MKLYRVRTGKMPPFGHMYEVIVIAEDAKHAERRARWSYWKMRKGKLIVEEMDMKEQFLKLIEYNENGSEVGTW